MARHTRECFITREEFMETLRATLGEINATITFINPRRQYDPLKPTAKTGVRFETPYAMLAKEIEIKARGVKANVFHTVTDNGVHVLTINQFGSKTWTVK
jgi:hypothetical protein